MNHGMPIPTGFEASNLLEHPLILFLSGVQNAFEYSASFNRDFIVTITIGCMCRYYVNFSSIFWMSRRESSSLFFKDCVHRILA